MQQKSTTYPAQILSFIESMAPERVTNSEIHRHTGIPSHQQVYLLTQELCRKQEIRGVQEGRDWYFWSVNVVGKPVVHTALPSDVNAKFDDDKEENTQEHRHFEQLAKQVLSAHFATPLAPGSVAGVRKKFDLVSSDGRIVGDAKFYTLVKGKKMPPAKFATIAEYVWLLEKSNAEHAFLVFGNDRRVAEWWLEKYGELLTTVAFYFLAQNGTLQRLTPP